MINQTTTSTYKNLLTYFVSTFKHNSSSAIKGSYETWKGRTKTGDPKFTSYDIFVGMSKCTQILNIHMVKDKGK